MEIQPLALVLVIDEVGAVALPEGQAPVMVIGIEGEHQNAGGQEGGPDGLAVVGGLDDVGGQGVHGDLPHGTGVEPGDLRVLFGQIDKAPVSVGIVVGHGVVPHLVKAAHDAEQMAPGGLFAGVPELAPLLLAVGGGVEIGVPGVEILRRLDALGVVDPLGQGQMGFHQPFSFL